MPDLEERKNIAASEEPDTDEEYWNEEEQDTRSEAEIRLDSLRERPYRFVRSFKARLIQSSDEVRFYYSEIKNELLTYRHCHARISWNHELFNSGRNHVVRMQIRGKTLVLYLALDPSECENSRFALEDVSASAKNQKTPVLFRVNSPAKCTYALELIARIMANIGADRKKDPLPPKMDFASVEYETTEALLNEDMIKLEMRVGATPKIIYLKKAQDEEEDEEDETSKEESEDTEENEETEGEEEGGLKALATRTYSFERSFRTRLIQSDEKVKFYYSELKNAAMAYKAVRARASWNHELFTAGRPVLMRLQIRGKTLCVYLPLDPDTKVGGRYSLEKAPETKKNAKTPSLVRITSQGKCSFVVSLIPKILAGYGKDKPAKDFEAVDYSTMPYETTETLLNKGLIRLVIRKDEMPDVGGLPMDEDAEDEALLGTGAEEEEEKKPEEPQEEEKEEIPEQEPEEGAEYVGVPEEKYDHVRVITRDRKDRINYDELLRNLEHGEGTFEYRKRYMLRAIDENWVSAIEEALPVIDKLIRNPTHTLQEEEDIVPIERSRKITQRSVQHLSQHVNMVSKVENGFVTPNKILNVYYEDTIKTYENKFLNTLLMRLFVFVNKRYEIVRKEATDVVRTSVSYEGSFRDEDSSTDGKIHFYMELNEKPKDILILKNYTFTTDLWKRVERLNKICMTNLNSEFCRQMGKTYVRPPIMRTNAIMKNKDFHQCLLLWQYIEGYENAGYELMIQEELKRPANDYLDEFCRTLTDQYMAFVHTVREGKNEEDTLDTFLTDHPILPKVTDKLGDLTEEEFDIELGPKNAFHPIPNGSRYRARRLTAYEKTVVEAVEVALEADRIMHSPNMEAELEKLDDEIAEAKKTAMEEAEQSLDLGIETPAEDTNVEEKE